MMDWNCTTPKVGVDTVCGESNKETFIMDYLNIEDSMPLRHTTRTIVVLLAAYLTVLIVGLVGNILVILIVAKIPKMKAATKYFILNLALADLLVLIFCLVPSLISNIYVPWVLGSFMCKAVPYIQGVSVCASAYSLAAISADRLMAIRFPLRRQVNKSVARRIIVLIWVWAAGLVFPWLLYFDLSNVDGKEPPLVFCVEIWPSRIHGNIYFLLVNLGLFYLFPLSFISVCHLIIWLRVRYPQAPTSVSVSDRQLVRKRAGASLQNLVIVIVVGFAICWLPLYVIFVRVKLIPAVMGTTEETVLDYLLPIAQWLGAANSCINPILYGIFNRNFRIALRRFLKGSFACRTPNIRPDSYHHRPSQGDGPRPNFARLMIALQSKNSQRKKPYQSAAIDASESNKVRLHQCNQKLPAIQRSQTYKAAMENPWTCTPMM